MTRIETERLVLRPWTLDDVDLWHQLAGDVGYTAFAPPGAFSVDDDEGARVFLRERVAQGARGLGKWPVFTRDGGVFVGTCGLSEYPIRDVPSVELGYRLLLAHWGRGYATEAARAMLDHGLRTLGRPRVHAFVAPENHASLRVIASLPFVRDGELIHAGLRHLLFVSSTPEASSGAG